MQKKSKEPPPDYLFTCGHRFGEFATVRADYRYHRVCPKCMRVGAKISKRVFVCAADGCEEEVVAGKTAKVSVPHYCDYHTRMNRREAQKKYERDVRSGGRKKKKQKPARSFIPVEHEWDPDEKARPSVDPRNGRLPLGGEASRQPWETEQRTPCRY